MDSKRNFLLWICPDSCLLPCDIALVYFYCARTIQRRNTFQKQNTKIYETIISQVEIIQDF